MKNAWSFLVVKYTSANFFIIFETDVRLEKNESEKRAFEN